MFCNKYLSLFILLIILPAAVSAQNRVSSLAVFAPTAQGLAADQAHLPLIIQGELVSNISRYSNISVLDRQRLEAVLKENESGIYSNETELAQLGQITNVEFHLVGSVTRAGENFVLQLNVVDARSGRGGITRASFSGNETLTDLNNLAGVRRASLDLMTQMGVTLTAEARQALSGAGSTEQVNAQTALARGITAERQGTTVEALNYYFMAAASDPSMREAISRVSTVSAAASGGNIGQTVRNRLQQHDDWQTVVNTTRTFYSNHLPYEFVYDTNISQGAINFDRRTTSLSIDISLIPLEDAWKIINDLRQGLNTARGWDNWNFNLTNLEPRQIIVTLEIINQNFTVISTASYRFNNPSERDRTNARLTFQNVKADDITDHLTVRVVNINNIWAQRAGQTGFIQISTSAEYHRRIAPEVARREREAKREERKANYSVIPPIAFELGYVYQPGYPFGFRIGFFGFYTTWNFHFPDWQGYETHVDPSPHLYWYYDKNGVVHAPEDYSVWYDSYKDLNSRVQESFEWVVGFSVNIIDNFLMLPVGFGARHSNEYGLFQFSSKWSDTSENIWISERERPGDWGTEFLFEIGLAFNPIRWISLLATYRLIGFQEHSFTIGTCLTVPLPMPVGYYYREYIREFN